jgi:hypothetical protein
MCPAVVLSAAFLRPVQHVLIKLMSCGFGSHAYAILGKINGPMADFLRAKRVSQQLDLL